MTADLARRAVATKGWRWLPGMLTLPFHEAGPDSPICHPPWRVVREGCSGPYANPNNNDAPPDLDDPATRGCMLALVREAWAHPYLCVVGDLSGWRIDAVTAAVGDLHSYATETEALVSALVAAP